MQKPYNRVMVSSIICSLRVSQHICTVSHGLWEVLVCYFHSERDLRTGTVRGRWLSVNCISLRGLGIFHSDSERGYSFWWSVQFIEILLHTPFLRGTITRDSMLGAAVEWINTLFMVIGFAHLAWSSCNGTIHGGFLWPYRTVRCTHTQ